MQTLKPLKITLILCAILFSVSLNAQIKSTIFMNGSAFNTFDKLQYVNINNIPVVNMPLINVDSLLNEDKILNEMGMSLSLNNFFLIVFFS